MKGSKFYGVGINDADYQVTRWGYEGDKRVRLWICPFYNVWRNLISRCYGVGHPYYEGCSVSEEWLTFSNFRAWMETQDWQGKQLDKDLLVRGNKIYGEEFCIFLPREVNIFLIERTKSRGKYPIGVSRIDDKSFCTSIGNGHGGTIRVGTYKTPEEAHEAWLSAKLAKAIELAGKLLDERASAALVERYTNYIP